MMRWPFKILRLFTLGMVRRCPQCGHRLAAHGRRPDGSFKD